MPIFPGPGGGNGNQSAPDLVTLGQYVRPGDNGDASLALQRAYDALPAGGGTIDLAGTSPTFKSRVYFDKPNSPETVTLRGNGKSSVATVDPSLGQVLAVGLTTGGFTYTDLTARPDDINAYVGGLDGGGVNGFPAATQITAVNTATGLVTVSNAWTGTPGAFAIYVERFVINANLARSPVAGNYTNPVGAGKTGIVSPGVIITNLEVQTATDQNNLLGFALTNQIGMWTYACSVDRIFRFAVTSGYTDAMMFSSCKYTNGPRGTNNTDVESGMGWFYEQTGSGDGLVVIDLKGGSGDPLLNISSCNGASISGVISGAMRFKTCAGIVIDGYHWDSNQSSGFKVPPGTANNANGNPCAVFSANSNLTFNNAWCHDGPSKAAGAADWHLLEVDDSNTGLPLQAFPSHVLFNGCTFSWRYDHTGNGIGAEDSRYNGFNIRRAGNGDVLTFVNCRYYQWRQAAGSMDGTHTPGAVWIDSLDWTTPNVPVTIDSNVATAALAGAELIASGNFIFQKTGTNQYKVRPLTGLQQTRSSGGAPTVNSVTNTTTLGTVAATVYSYCVAVRNADGAFGTPSATVALGAAATAGTTNDIVVTMPRTGSWVLVIFKATGGADPRTAPSAYAVLPFHGSNRVIKDTGARVDGIAWNTTAVPVPTTVAAVDNTWDGYYTGDGAKVVTNLAASPTAFPTDHWSGPWNVGDRIIYKGVSGGGKQVAVCTVASVFGTNAGTWTEF